MFINQNDYDKLNARPVELSRQLRDANLKIMQLEDKLEEINKIATRNTYGNAELNLRKIKELVIDDKSNN